MLQWNFLTNEDQLQLITKNSFTRPQVLFKHSTRCGTSNIALSRLDRSSENHGADFYFLDLIRYRNISNQVAKDFEVYHESPQILIIKNGECVYDESHLGIIPAELFEQIQTVQ